LFSHKTAVLRKSLQKAIPAAPARGHLPQYPGGVELTYLNGPFPLELADIPGIDPKALQGGSLEKREAYGWWRRDPITQKWDKLELTLGTLKDCLKKDGPFDGVIGFSQGAALAGFLTSLLETSRQEVLEAAKLAGKRTDGYPKTLLGEEGQPIHPPFKFAVCYAGFMASEPGSEALYNPKITTPVLHVIGSLDTVVPEDRMLDLVNACEPAPGSSEGSNRWLLRHPGGHFVPTGKMEIAGLVGFIKESVAPPASDGEAGIDERL
jgi:predicted esterase